MPGGPKPMARARRLELSFEIAAQVQRHYRDRVLAVGVYGSVARGTDEPYSVLTTTQRGKSPRALARWAEPSTACAGCASSGWANRFAFPGAVRKPAIHTVKRKGGYRKYEQT